MTTLNLRGRSVLVVVSDIYTNIDLQDALAEAGAKVVAAFGLERGLLRAACPSLSAAVIESSLAKADGGAVCRRLDERKVPFVVVGGQMTSVPGTGTDASLMTKATDTHAVVEAVAGLLLNQAAMPQVAVIGRNFQPAVAIGGAE
jgi:DNA-binding response OmpR family regulator